MTWVKPYMELRFVVDVGWPLPYLTGEAMTASTEPQVMMLASYTPSSLTDTHGLAFMTTRRDHGGSVARAMPLRPILGPFIGVSLFHALCSLCLLLGVRSIWLRMNGPGTIPTS